MDQTKPLQPHDEAGPAGSSEPEVTLHQANALRALVAKIERAEHALRDSEEQFRSVVEAAPDAIVVADQHGRIVSWNRAAQRLFGFTPDEIRNQPLWWIIPPRFREAHRQGLERYRTSGVARLLGQTVELFGLRKDGSEFPLELSLTSWTTRRGTFFSGIIRDIAERKRAEATLREHEERFRQLAENIREVFWMTTPDKDKLLYVSPAYEEIWGRTCNSLYEHPRSWLDAIHPEDRPRVEAAALTKQVRGAYREEYRIVRPDGSLRWILDQAFPIRNEAGTVYRVAGIAEDITEWKQLQAQLIQAEKLASLGTLVSGMAHEINNPVQGILGMAEIILQEEDCARIKECARDIVEYSQHVATVVRNFSAYARPSAQESETELMLSDRLAEAVKMVQRSLKFGQVEIVLQLEPVPPIRARRTEIDQIFVNLIANAVQAMGGHGVLTLATQRRGDTLCVRVSDTGCGIPRSLQSQIFDPFFTTKEPGQGTGLGLSVALKLVTKYGGTICVESEAGQGATFVVQFPVSRPDTPAKEEFHDEPASSQSRPGDAGPAGSHPDRG
ncbi:PAS domain-containing sensor histidine kinase [Nitrospira sp. Kam-Ns4a]